MSTEKSIPILAPPAYTPTNQPYYQQPIPQAHFVATVHHNQGFADPEYPHHEAEGTKTSTVIVAEKTVRTKGYDKCSWYLMWAIVCVGIICCPFFGCIALCFLTMARSYRKNGRYSRAKSFAKAAMITAGVGISIPVLAVVITVTVVQYVF